MADIAVLREDLSAIELLVGMPALIQALTLQICTMPRCHDRHAYLGRRVTDKSGSCGIDVQAVRYVFAKDCDARSHNAAERWLSSSQITRQMFGRRYDLHAT